MSIKIEVVAYANGDELSNLLGDRTATVVGVADGWRGTGLVRFSDHQSEADRLTEWARANQQLAQGAMDKLEDALADCDRLKMHLADHRTTLDAMSSCADSSAPVVERQPVAATAWEVTGRNGYGLHREFPKWTTGDAELSVKALYAAPPELAELQATIAKLREELDGTRLLAADQLLKIKHQRIEIERLKGGQEEPFGWFTDDHTDDKSATTYTPAVAERWRAKGWPVTPFYTSQPAPVSVPDGWKLVPIEPTAEMLRPIARSKWPEDMEAGKRLQRLRGPDVVFYKTETECAVGQYERMLAAAPEYIARPRS